MNTYHSPKHFIIPPAYAFAVADPSGLQGMTLGGIFGGLLPNIMTIAGLLAFGFLIFGGFKYIMAGGDPKAIEAAQKTITQAMIGLVIVFGAYGIMAVLQTVLGIEILGG